MERARLTVIILLCVWLCEEQKVFGTEVDMRVKLGESVTLYCALPFGSDIIWMRNCSHENQPSLSIDRSTLFKETFPRFSFVPNSSSNSYDLHIENVSVSDEGLYYCGKRETKIYKDERGIKPNIEYEYGNKTTRLFVLEQESPCAERFNSTSTSPASECVFCWNLLFSVCSVCVLLFSVCVYCLCQKKTTVSVGSGAENRHVEAGDEVCYASLDMPSTQQQRQRNKRAQSSDFSIYSNVRTSRI
ncbi:uncharacterized protein [Danio rerio]|uniref:Uncharacterized protein n=1 Tax=Danio rerio TaxID=7955 RepID=A0AC58JGX9_DANRE